jgi:hypothetical protein
VHVAFRLVSFPELRSCWQALYLTLLSSTPGTASCTRSCTSEPSAREPSSQTLRACHRARACSEVCWDPELLCCSRGFFARTIPCNLPFVNFCSEGSPLLSPVSAAQVSAAWVTSWTRWAAVIRCACCRNSLQLFVLGVSWCTGSHGQSRCNRSFHRVSFSAHVLETFTAAELLGACTGTKLLVVLCKWLTS